MSKNLGLLLIYRRSSEKGAENGFILAKKNMGRLGHSNHQGFLFPDEYLNPGHLRVRASNHLEGHCKHFSVALSQAELSPHKIKN